MLMSVKQSSRSLRWIALGLVVASAACLDSAYKARVRRLVPARMHMDRLKSLAIVDFDGEAGEAVASSIEHTLATTTPWHVVDRKVVRHTLAQQGLWGASHTQPSAVGDALGADVLLVGTVGVHRVKEDFSWDARFAQDGSPYTIYSRTGQILVQVTLRGIEAATGANLGVVTLDASTELPVETVRIDDAAQASPNYLLQLFAPLPEVQLLADADRKLAQQFLHTILPHEETTEVCVYVHSDFRASVLAIEALERGDFTAAVALYEQANAQASSFWYRPKIKARARYNLGVALGCQGRYDEAAQAIHQAALLDPDPLFSAYLTTLQDYRRDAMDLPMQLRDQHATSFAHTP